MIVEGAELPENPLEISNEPNGESNLVSFVVRIWKEDSASEEEPSWRGHLAPVPGGERHYFNSIREIPSLIAAHLKIQG